MSETDSLYFLDNVLSVCSAPLVPTVLKGAVDSAAGLGQPLQDAGGGSAWRAVSAPSHAAILSLWPPVASSLGAWLLLIPAGVSLPPHCLPGPFPA